MVDHNICPCGDQGKTTKCWQHKLSKRIHFFFCNGQKLKICAVQLLDNSYICLKLFQFPLCCDSSVQAQRHNFKSLRIILIRSGEVKRKNNKKHNKGAVVLTLQVKVNHSDVKKKAFHPFSIQCCLLLTSGFNHLLF